MPEFTSTLLFDALLALIILLFVPFGIRRGAAKEAMGSAGLLLGTAIAEAWGPTVSRWLANLIGLSGATAAFVVTLLFVVAGMVLVGYGGGIALGRTRPGWLSRVVGGIIAALNAAFLLSVLLVAVQRNLKTDGELDAGMVSGFLMNDPDLLLLAAAVVMLVVVVAGWLVNAFRGDSPAPESALARRERPVRVATGADSVKYEPAPMRPDPSLMQTAPIPSPTDPWQRPPGNGGAAPAPANPWMSWGQPRTGSVMGGDTIVEVRRTCPTCGATAAATDVYCQECGKTL